MKKEQIINKIGLPILYISIWLILYNLPRRFFYVGGDNGIEGWLIALTTFLILPILLFQIASRNGITLELSKIIAYGSVFLIFPFIFFMQSEDQNEMGVYKKEIVGIVNKAWMMNRRKKNPIWSVQAKYEVEGKVYQTSSKEDKDKTLNLGDTITIIYSAKNPQMSEIKELKKHYGK